MKKSNFWSEASRGGAIIGLVGIAFALLGMLIHSYSILQVLLPSFICCSILHVHVQHSTLRRDSPIHRVWVLSLQWHSLQES